MGSGHWARLPLNQLWREGKGEQGQLGAKATAEPPKAACYPSPRGLHPGPACLEKGLEERPNPKAINTSAGIVRSHGMLVRTGASGGGLAWTLLSVPPRVTPESPRIPFLDRVEAGPHLSRVEVGPGHNSGQDPPKLP